MEELQARLDQIQKNQTDIEETARRWKDSINKNYKDLDSFLSKLKNQQKELNHLKQLAGLSKSAKVNSLPAPVKSQIDQISSSINRIKSSLTPRTGRVNVKQYKDGERFRLKQEYQKFKRKTDLLFLLFVVAQLFVLPENRVIEMLFQIWLLYYYVTLALRENILKVNGSNIKEWWIIHHYLSIGVSLAILTWSTESESYLHFLPQFLYFSLFQAFVQILQDRYQAGKLYKLIALNKADAMDVTGEGLLKESSSGSGTGFLDSLSTFSVSFNFLLPFLLFVQLFQLYNAYTLLNLFYEKQYSLEWQVFTSGILFLALGLGNLYSTMETYVQKYKQS